MQHIDLKEQNGRGRKIGDKQRLYKSRSLLSLPPGSARQRGVPTRKGSELSPNSFLPYLQRPEEEDGKKSQKKFNNRRRKGFFHFFFSSTISKYKFPFFGALIIAHLYIPRAFY